MRVIDSIVRGLLSSRWEFTTVDKTERYNRHCGQPCKSVRRSFHHSCLPLPFPGASLAINRTNFGQEIAHCEGAPTCALAEVVLL
jgi:hypothetical protein